MRSDILSVFYERPPNFYLPFGEPSVRPMNSMQLFSQAVSRYSPRHVAVNLGLNLNTIKRWMDRKDVPANYTADLARLLGKEYVGNGEREKDQFYTKPEVAKSCYARFKEVAKGLGVDLRRYAFIEPSAGCGGFYDLLPSARRIGIDIDPRYKGLVRADYLTWAPADGGRYVVIGNPPFGLRGHLALQFINHSYQFADMIAFILPPLFNSDGKGVPAKRVKGYTLAHTENLAPDSFVYPDGRLVDVSAIFQVWTKIRKENISIPRRRSCKDYVRVYSLSDGGTPSSTRNKRMLYKCDVYLPSTCFTGMHAYGDFEALPHRRGYGVVIHKAKREIKKLLLGADWSKAAFRSTNGALNLRTSLIENVVIQAGYHN